MRLLALTLLVSACAHQQDPPVAKVVHDDAPPPTAATPLSEDDCGRMYDHICDLMLATLPPQDRPATREELEAARGPVVHDCTEGRVTREKYDCFMKASTAEALRVCAPADPGDEDDGTPAPGVEVQHED